MAPLDPPYVTQPAGSGPRRLQLHPNGRILYLARETDSHVTAFAVDTGRLKDVQSISALPNDYSGANTTAEILIDKRGTFLYVSNRGHGSIAVYDTENIVVLRVDRATGRLSATGAQVPLANTGSIDFVKK